VAHCRQLHVGKALTMVKVKTSQTRIRVVTPAQSRESLFMIRIRELDREFARQTKQLTALTKKLGKKLNEPITFKKKTKD
jgi:hypothetical protein